MPSDFINRKLAQTILRAFDFAKYIGKPLNTYAVINFHGIDAHAADRVLQAVRHKCRVWMKRKQRQAGDPEDAPLYVYSLECPNGKDVHVNWVLHVPSAFQAEFRRKLPEWVKKAQGTAPRPCDLDVQDVDPHTDKSLAKYILKGTDPLFVPHFHLQNYAAPQGPIHGRRAGASMSLNKSARKAAGFIASRHRNLWKKQAWAQHLPVTVPLVLPIAAHLAQSLQHGIHPNSLHGV